MPGWYLPEPTPLPEKPKQEVDVVDYNPDHQRSSRKIIAEESDGEVRMIIPVRGLGVILLRGSTKEDGFSFDGVSTITKEEIGPCNGL